MCVVNNLHIKLQIHLKKKFYHFKKEKVGEIKREEPKTKKEKESNLNIMQFLQAKIFLFFFFLICFYFLFPFISICSLCTSTSIIRCCPGKGKRDEVYLLPNFSFLLQIQIDHTHKIFPFIFVLCAFLFILFHFFIRILFISIK